ncbi:MAG: putative membrane protein [Haloquadratum sp. J07HQX50]|nr:MAG: putative membrane protein [Haloquadratum sp. J07HQX50]
MSTEYGPIAIWSVILTLGILTYTIRASFVTLFGLIDDVPPEITNALRYVPPAVLAALTVPAFLSPTGSVEIIGNERVFAGIAATAAAWYFDDVTATIVVGMCILWIIRFGL